MKTLFDPRFSVLLDCEPSRPFEHTEDSLELPSVRTWRLNRNSSRRPGLFGFSMASLWRGRSSQIRRSSSAFSLVEVLAAVALIGIITFLALPNIVQIKQDSEESLAISRAEALNLSMASFVQARGQTAASSLWTSTAAASRYGTLLAPYLAYAPSSFTNYMPNGYTATLPTAVLPLSKVALTGPSGTISY